MTTIVRDRLVPGALALGVLGLASQAGLPAAAVSVGAGQAAAGADVAPFTIAVPDAVLDDLQVRLARARFPDELEGAGWDVRDQSGLSTQAG